MEIRRAHGSGSEVRASGRFQVPSQSRTEVGGGWDVAGRCGHVGAVLCAGRSEAGRCARVRMAARGWMWGAGEGQGPIIGGAPDISAREQGWKATGITAGSAARPFRGRVTEGKKLTGGVRLPVRGRGAG